MSDEPEFLRAIAANPGDDKLRLAYADWLSQHGDPSRAELIRIQCELEQRTGLQGTRNAGGNQLTELRAWEKALISEMLAPAMEGNRPGIRELTPEVSAAVAGRVPRITFRRGLIENLDLRGTSITGLPPDLFIGGNLYLQVAGITALPSRLRVGGNLYLHGTPITAVPTDLQVGGSLDLDGTLITALPSGFRVGGSLCLSHTGITELPPGLQVGGDLSVAHTGIKALPPDLYVKGNINLHSTGFSTQAARRILTMPNLSRHTKVTALRTAGFPALVGEIAASPDRCRPFPPPTP